MRAYLSPLLLLAAPAIAQTAPVATPVPDATSAADLLAFTDTDARMTVPVQIAGAGPYRFVIDTGAQRTVISRELAGVLHLPKGRDVRVTAMSGTTLEGTVVIPSIQVSSAAASRVEAPALWRANLGALGLLGIDTLQGHAVSIDFDAKTMALRVSSKRRRHEDHLPNEIVVRARSMFGQLVVTDAYCDGQRVRVVLDTGTAISMGNLALQRRFARRGHTPHPIELVSVTGQRVPADYGQIDSVKIGDLSITALPIAFADVAPFRHFGLGDTPAILLGMDALQLFRRVEIDFANRELRLALPRGVAQQRPAEGVTSLPLG